MDHVIKIYYVNHTRQYFQDSNPFNREHFSKIPIGFFYSKKKAMDLIKAYRKLPGFTDFPKGFYIDEYVVDSIFNEQINQFIIDNEDVKEPDVLFSISYIRENEDDEIEIDLLGFFSTKEKAENARKYLLEIPEFKKIDNDLNVYEEYLDKKEYSEGFITWDEAMRSFADSC